MGVVDLSHVRWVAIDVRVDDNEPSAVGPASEVRENRERFAAGLIGPHRLVGQSCGGDQYVTYCVTSDLAALLGLARRTLPPRGVASADALVWWNDPRQSSTPHCRARIAGPQPRERGLGPG